MANANQATRVLVVDDDAGTRALLHELVKQDGMDCRVCGGVREAEAALATFQPQIVILDFQLKDGCGTDLLDHVRHSAVQPAVVVVSGEAQATDAFELAQLGARAFVAKPLTPETVRRALRAAAEETADLVPIVRNVVGRMSVHDAQALVRDTMVHEALGQSHGSRSGAARLLRISRQLIQHMIRGLEDAHPANTSRQSRVRLQ